MIREFHSKTLTGLVIEGDYSVTAEAAELIPHVMQMEQPSPIARVVFTTFQKLFLRTC